ncbi:undecaprenyl-phosphate 4-deoxy-4-formamido-L-arabinose transferase, partial [Escherichia coli]|nr:undecaprenyl-phosphate 4-deoxy-4-formamido-L-arabinose transferase [Escherichia coli]
ANIFARQAVEIPVHHAEREFGESKYSFMRLINLMYDLVTCLTTTPLRMLSLLGSIIATSGFSLAILLVVLRLAFGSQWSGEGVFMLFAVLFTFIGAQFIGMGLLGEYIGRIYNDVRARPRYFVQKVIRPASSIDIEENH